MSSNGRSQFLLYLNKILNKWLINKMKHDINYSTNLYLTTSALNVYSLMDNSISDQKIDVDIHVHYPPIHW